MGLLDYYKQFQGLSDDEVSAELRERSAERKAKALERVDPADLSRTTWPGLPHPYVVSAITYAARRGMHTYADPNASELRSEIAHRLGVEDRRVAVGNGIAQLMSEATAELLEPGDELVTPWPSYPLYPILARRFHGRAVPVPGFGSEPILAAINDKTRIVVVCNPNDPTGDLLGVDELDDMLGRLPERVVVFLDEALVDYVDAQPRDAALELIERHPRLLVFRTFSKAWGLAGLRCGFVVGGEGSEAVLEHLEPDLGIDELAQAGVLEALRTTGTRIDERVALVRKQRARVVEGLRDTPYEVAPTQANVVWIKLPGVDGAELARRLETHHVLVQSGGGIGSPDHVRASVHLPEHADRLLWALDLAATEDAAHDGAHAR